MGNAFISSSCSVFAYNVPFVDVVAVFKTESLSESSEAKIVHQLL